MKSNTTILCLPVLALFKKKKKCIYLFLRERMHTSREGQREREGEKIPIRLCTLSAEPDAGPELTNRDRRLP